MNWNPVVLQSIINLPVSKGIVIFQGNTFSFFDQIGKHSFPLFIVKGKF